MRNLFLLLSFFFPFPSFPFFLLFSFFFFWLFSILTSLCINTEKERHYAAEVDPIAALYLFDAFHVSIYEKPFPRNRGLVSVGPFFSFLLYS
jgi:hypothetical protein